MKKKITFVSSIFLLLFVLLGFFSIVTGENAFVVAKNRLLNLAGIYTEEISSVTISHGEYSFETPGTWNITKNAKWTDKGKAEVTFLLDSYLKEKDSKKDVIVVLDASSNMTDEKMSVVKDSTKVLMDQVLEKDDQQISLISYENEAMILSNLTRNKELLNTRLNQILPSGSSNYNSGLQAVLEVLEGYQKQEGKDVIVLFVAGGYSSLENGYETVTYQIIKEKYPYVTIQGIQYERGTELHDDIKNISDYQWIANQKNFKEKLLEAGLSPERYTKFIISDTIHSDYFDIDGVSADLGEPLVDDHTITWDLSGKYVSGSTATMKVQLSLKMELLDQEGFYPVSQEMRTLSQLPEQGERNVDSIKVNVLQNQYQVIYDSNVPTGCANQDLETEKYMAYDIVEMKTPELSCVGYQFKGWEFDSEDGADIQKVNEETFVMPGHNVTIRGTWGKHEIVKTTSGSRGHTYFVTFDAKNGDAVYTKEVSKSIVLPEPTAVANRAFIGWFDGDTEVGRPGEVFEPTQDVTLVGKWEITVATFNYTGGEQSFTVPKSGYYRLEVWGAQGSNYSGRQGGFGGYSTSVVYLEKNQVVYVHVGGQGAAKGTNTYGAGGYNGGANGGCYSIYCCGGGGGATHMAFDRGILSTLSSHAQDDRILIVAGGGGGSSCGDGDEGLLGSGGGYKGVDDRSVCGVSGGTQTSGYAFGLGGTGGNSGNPGSGGGYYGGQYGYCFSTHEGAGGSGYIANTKTFGKHMTCYNCAVSNALSTRTITNSCYDDNPVADCAKKGHGYAKISDMGDAITKITVELDAKGGNLSSNTMDFLYNDTYAGLPIPNYSGKIFMGWYTEDNIKITDSMKVDKSIKKLYAKWDDGRAIEYIEIGNYLSNKSFTIDVKNYTDRYQNITLDNFYMQNVKLETVNGSATANDASQILTSYDPTTGILSLHNATGKYGSYMSFTLYVIFDTEHATNLGSYNTYTAKTINIKDKVHDHTALTKNNIFVKNANMGYASQNSSNVTNQCIGDYDATTGDLKLLQAIYIRIPSVNTFDQFYVNYQLYVFDGTMVKLN